ncbi:MAG: peptide deformylase [Candidatus Hodgkinia cicadicola]
MSRQKLRRLRRSNSNPVEVHTRSAHSLDGKAQSSQGWARVFDLPCSLRQYPEAGLRLAAPPLELFKLPSLELANRAVALLLVHGGLGISSVQIGWPLAIFALSAFTTSALKRVSVVTGWLRHKPGADEGGVGLEACLSVANVTQPKKRLKHSVLIYVSLASVRTRIKALKTYGELAACWQHESDHANGQLITDLQA